MARPRLRVTGVETVPIRIPFRHVLTESVGRYEDGVHIKPAQAVIVLSEGGYSQSGRDYWCVACTDARLRRPVPPPKRPRAR